MKALAHAIAAVGLSGIGAYLLTHDHGTAGAWLIVLAAVCVLG
jgi:hypothetical protein